jgi:pyrrolidone-carboxylate peptidase
MKVVELRSPFIIEINEAGQNGSKIELFIWNGSTIPATPTYTLSKNISSPTQLSTIYNVSNYVKEYIDNIKATYNEFTTLEQNNEWVKFRVKRYKIVTGVDTLLNTTDYIGVNGFTSYTSGNQNPSESVMEILSNTNISNYYYQLPTYPNNLIQYVNILFDKPTTTTTTIVVKYERIDGIIYSLSENVLGGVSGIYNIKIRISLAKLDGNFINGCKVTITYTPASGSPTIKTFFTYPIEECKYTPVLCDFVNRYGGWQTITFFKAQTNSVTVKRTDYKLSQQALNYNTSIGQFKTMNTNGKQTVKLNTGFVDENYSELITDLLLSETVLLDNKPVTVKTQGSDLKTSLKDKLINYEMEFEYAYNLINDVV